MSEITDLLQAFNDGNAEASRKLFAIVYDDLKRIAHRRLNAAGSACELGTTGLVHESFLRFSERGELHVGDRRAFFGYVGRVMRSVLIDSAREQLAQKRGGGLRAVTLTTGANAEAFDAEQLLSLDSAMTSLERLAPSLHRIVELRYFAGMSVDEIAELLGTSSRTVEREWVKARTLLRKLLSEGASKPL